MKKTCSSCGHAKDTTDFPLDRGRRRPRCRTCFNGGRRHTASTKNGPRILVVDIETAPMSAHMWTTWGDQNIPLEFVTRDWFVLCFAAKWLGEKKVHYRGAAGRNFNDPAVDLDILEALWRLLDEADIVVGHNVRRFDLKKIQARMIQHGMRPFSPVRVIDTLQIAKEVGAFSSNKMSWLTQMLPQHKSKHTEFPGTALWLECLANNPAAWVAMEKYNKQDVISNEPLFLRLRPWARGLPNLATYDDDETMRCPTCKSPELARKGWHYTQAGKYPRWHCQNCGAYPHERYTVNSASKRRSLLAA